MMTANNDISKPAIKSFLNIRAFTRQDLIMGLPAKIFVAGLTLSMTLGIALHWWAALLTAMGYFPVMFTIHREDPQALSLWIRALMRKEYSFRGGFYLQRRIIWL